MVTKFIDNYALQELTFLASGGTKTELEEVIKDEKSSSKKASLLEKKMKKDKEKFTTIYRLPNNKDSITLEDYFDKEISKLLIERSDLVLQLKEVDTSKLPSSDLTYSQFTDEHKRLLYLEGFNATIRTNIKSIDDKLENLGVVLSKDFHL